MNCLEFKRLALSDPHSKQADFVSHGENCAECLKYVGGVRKMDSDLAHSLDVNMPADLVARLKLNQEMASEEEVQTPARGNYRRYAIAASLTLMVFVAGFMASNQFGLHKQIDNDYQSLLAGVIEHMHEVPMTPVLDAATANNNAQTLLASYDGNMKLKYMSNLQFTRICPMGQYRGIHASLDTPNGQVTFAYIKGEPVGELLNTSYEGMITRVKPVRGGNLIIVSNTNKALQQADTELQEAMYWDI